MRKSLRSTLILQACADVAVLAHHGVARKQSSAAYVTHPIGVMQILTGLGVEDPCVLGAALLHDVVEDTSIASDALRLMLKIRSVESGDADRIVDIVVALSETKLGDNGAKLPWKTRKLLHLAHLEVCDDLEVLLVKLADCLHNTRTVAVAKLVDPEADEKFASSQDEQHWYRMSIVDLAADFDQPAMRLLARLLGEEASALSVQQ